MNIKQSSVTSLFLHATIQLGANIVLKSLYQVAEGHLGEKTVKHLKPVFDLLANILTVNHITLDESGQHDRKSMMTGQAGGDDFVSSIVDDLVSGKTSLLGSDTLANIGSVIE